TAASRQAARASALRTARLPVACVLRPTEAADGPPPRRRAQLLAIVLRPPRAVLQHGGVGCGRQPRLQRRLPPGSTAARTARNGLALQRACLALLHDGAFDRRHGHPTAASGFSPGLTVSHRSHQALFPIGRIRTPIRLVYTTPACLCFSQVALSNVLS